MKKVVYSVCFGGFGLSREALAMLLLMGFSLNSVALEDSEFTAADFPLSSDYGLSAHHTLDLVLKDGRVYDDSCFTDFSSSSAALRSHPMLVKVVELLGEKAYANSADLRIKELADDASYRIQDYDGKETVVEFTPDRYTSGHVWVDVSLPAELQIAANQQLLSAPPEKLPPPDPWSEVWKGSQECDASA